MLCLYVCFMKQGSSILLRLFVFMSRQCPLSLDPGLYWYKSNASIWFFKSMKFTKTLMIYEHKLKVLKKKVLPIFWKTFSFCPTKTQNIHVLSREQIVYNVKGWRSHRWACVQKIFPRSPSLRFTLSQFCKFSNIIWSDTS